MAEHRVHVVPHEGAWCWRHENGSPEGRFSTQAEAVQAAKDHARQHGDHEVIIHDESGRIRDSDTMDRAHEGSGKDTR
jgi:hypothetical protein